MNMWWLALNILFSLWFCSVHGQVIKYSSSCSVDLCTFNNPNNSSGNVPCANLPLCYHFTTVNNLSLCAPQVVCSLFDPCTIAKKCATNTSVCVVNTCCAAPICMPLALTSSCSMYAANSTQNPGQNIICPNATWGNSTIVINSNLNSTYWANLGDFFVDNNNNLYVIDANSYRILKYALNNPSVFNVAAVTSVTSTYQAQNLFVDSNGTIYTAESWYDPTSVSNYYQVAKYNQNGGMSGTVVYGPTTCGTNVSQLCGCAGLFVDRTGLIYYSDTSNQRVLTITPSSSSVSVVAGTSGVSGSQLNQLNIPRGIYVDGNGALYVADQSNSRVMKFASGSLTGTILFTLPSYQAPTSLILDNTGSVYAGTYNGIFKWIPASNTIVQVASPQQFWGTNNIQFDTYGNIYLNGYMMSNIYRYNITNNSC